MLWLILIFVSGFLAAAGGVFLIYRAQVAQLAKLTEVTQTLKEELEHKRTLLADAARYSLHLVGSDELEKLRNTIVSEEDRLRAEKGRLELLGAELEEARVKVSRQQTSASELEAASREASHELEILQTEEANMVQKNDALKRELDESVRKLDELLVALADSEAISGQLNGAKRELLEGQKRIEMLQHDISNLNAKYLELKRAYDALDIEYAHLYEQQSNVGSVESPAA